MQSARAWKVSLADNSSWDARLVATEPDKDRARLIHALIADEARPILGEGANWRISLNYQDGAFFRDTIQRNGATLELDAETGESESQARMVANAAAFHKELGGMTPEQRRALKIDHGLLVEEATGDGARAGIRTGDIILAVNNTTMRSVEDFRKIIATIPKGKSAAILVRRGEGSLYIPLKISGD